MEYRQRTPELSQGLWWQIASGVFLALMAHSIVVGAYANYAHKRELRALDAQATQQLKSAARQTQAGRAAARHPQQAPAQVRVRPLAEGERCIQGRRFERVENGWVQLPYEPC